MSSQIQWRVVKEVAPVRQVYQQRQCLQQYLGEDKGNGRQKTLKIMGEPNVGEKKHVQLQSLSFKGSVFLQLM